MINPLRLIKHLLHEWVAAFVSTLPNDVLSCNIRRHMYCLLGYQVARGALIYRNVLLLGSIKIGARTSVSNNSILSGSQAGITIGEDVMIAPNCCIVAFDHGMDCGATPMIRQPLVESPIRIGNNVWIGANCTITRGVSIANGAVIAANSVVTRDVQEDEIVGGAPARNIRFRHSPLRMKNTILDPE